MQIAARAMKHYELDQDTRSVSVVLRSNIWLLLCNCSCNILHLFIQAERRWRAYLPTSRHVYSIVIRWWAVCKASVTSIRARCISLQYEMTSLLLLHKPWIPLHMTNHLKLFWWERASKYSQIRIFKLFRQILIGGSFHTITTLPIELGEYKCKNLQQTLKICTWDAA
jgi:hypothetical protein